MPKREPEAEALERVRQADKERAMTVLVGLSGDTHTASKVLENEKPPVFFEPNALEAMRNGECRALYEELQERFATATEDSLIRAAREIAARAMLLERRLLDETERQLALGKLSDPSRAAANVSKVKQTAVDKLLALTGRPTTITQHQDAAQIIRALEGKGVLVPIHADIDSTAEEDTAA